MLDQSVKQEFEFTEIDWFSQHIPLWKQIIALLPEREKFLEVGSFEGRSACWLMEHGLSPTGSLYAVDTWQCEGMEHFIHPATKDGLFERFNRNIKLARQQGQHLFVFRNKSHLALADLIRSGHEATFDLIYIDAGHLAKETLTDAVMAWPLLKSGGIMVFDDYLWELDKSLEQRPKMAIDVFTSIFHVEQDLVAIGHQYAVKKR